MAVTELAIGLPVLVLLVFGAMQTGRSVQLRHLGTLITDEVSRDATDPTVTDNALIAEAVSLAHASGLQSVSARVVHNTNDNLVRVEVEIPLSPNYSGPLVVPGPNIVSAATTSFKRYNP